MKLRVALALEAGLAAVVVIGVLASESGPTPAACPSGPRLAPIIHRGANLAPPGQSKPVPLVIGLHGSGNTPAYLERQTGLDQVADRNGFVVAYLGSQTPTTPSWTRCNLSSNLSYISAEIDRLIDSQNIDPSRVYVTGFSAGATMSFRVGCALSRQVAAIAPVSGWMQNGEACRLSRPESMMLIIGTNDAAPINGTARLMSVSEVASLWQDLNGCNHLPSVDTTVGPVNERAWSQCDDASGVAEYVIQGGTHLWPPAKGADRYVNASQTIWAFFSAHPAASATAPSVELSSVGVRHSGVRRWVRIAMRVDENAVVLKARLSERSRPVASQVFDLSRGAGRQAILSVPEKARQGRYKLTLVFSDRYGRRMTIVRTVNVTKPPTK